MRYECLKCAACESTWGPCAHSLKMDRIVYLLTDDVTSCAEFLRENVSTEHGNNCVNFKIHIRNGVHYGLF